MSSPPLNAVAQRFGRYLLLEQIGRGGMAEVYRAMAQGLEGFQRVFVIKRILKDKSSSKEFVEMFVNEARISALLNHQNIVQIYDFGQIDGSYFLAMEYLRGKDLLSTLRQLRNSGRLMSPEVAAFIAHEVANGLHYAHNLNQGGKGLDIVHRDVSPSNVMLLRAGAVKLLDFGIAKAAMQIATESNTQVGLVKGKLSYASPEQIRGTPIDRRADIFALGVVLWECLTGKRLFYDKNDYQTMRNVLDRPVPPPSLQRMDVPPALDYIVIRALERDPDRRYPNAKMMADELGTFLEEARFAPGAVTKLLDELFGEDAGESEAPSAMPAFDEPAAGAVPAAEAPKAATAPTVGAVPAAPAPSDGSGYAVVSSVRKIIGATARKKNRWTVSALGLLVAAAGIVFVLSRGPGQPPASDPAPARVTPAAAVAPAPAPAAAPTPPKTVTAKIDSDPPGAEIKDEDGTLLGTTPAVLTLGRTDAPTTLVVAKPGFQPSRHAIVPDRDLAALVTLRATARQAPARPVARPTKRPAGKPAATDGKVREGLSIDPFAEDGTTPKEAE